MYRGTAHVTTDFGRKLSVRYRKHPVHFSSPHKTENDALHRLQLFTNRYASEVISDDRRQTTTKLNQKGRFERAYSESIYSSSWKAARSGMSKKGRNETVRDKKRRLCASSELSAALNKRIQVL